MRRRVMRHDANHNSIVQALRKCGAKVLDLSGVGSDCPDLLVGWRSSMFLMEVKNPDNWYGKKGLTEGQRKFADGWSGNPVLVVKTVEEALKAIGCIK